MKKNVLVGLILFGLGLLGILSMLTMDIPLPPEAEAVLKGRFTPQQIKLLTLINPTILLVIAVIIGTLLYQKVNLSAPLVESFVGVKMGELTLYGILKYGIIGGLLSGVLLSLTAYIFTPILPEEFVALGESIKPSLAARFLYGGITEEILMRFGLMTTVVWLVSKIFKGTPPKVYWIGIIVCSLVFALGHFPIAFQAVENPSTLLLLYILTGNSIGGFIFAVLYWKKGLESAFIAHISTHVVMLVLEPLLLN